MIWRGLSDTNILVERNRTVQRLSVNVRVGYSTTSGLTLPDLASVQMKCILRRNGREHIIFADNLQVLALESMFFTSIECLQHPGYLSLMSGSISSLPYTYGQHLLIDLKSPINLQGDDTLSLEVAVTSAWLPSPAMLSFASGSTIEMVWREAIGVETFIPVIRSKYIQAGISKVDEAIGDDITSLAFINTQGASPGSFLTDATAIIQQMTITSDRYNINDTLDRMIARRRAQFETQGISDLHGFSFVLIPEGECDQVKVSLQMNALNVLVSKNVLVWRTYIVDKTTVARSARMHEKHDRRNTNKLKQHLGETA